MSSEPSPNPERNRLPFEPLKNRKKTASEPDQPQATAKAKASGNTKPAKRDQPKAAPKSGTPQPAKKPEPAKSESVKSSAPSKRSQDFTPPYTKEEMAIPQVVSRRMANRMAIFCGIPSTLGVVVFFAAYFVVSQGIVKLPTVAVLLSSMGCFGLGVLGLSYGVLSASWDEDVPGSPLGWSEFKANFGRMVEGWRATKAAKQTKQQN